MLIQGNFQENMVKIVGKQLAKTVMKEIVMKVLNSNSSGSNLLKFDRNYQYVVPIKCCDIKYIQRKNWIQRGQTFLLGTRLLFICALYESKQMVPGLNMQRCQWFFPELLHPGSSSTCMHQYCALESPKTKSLSS